jgi:hypothetical protein
MSKLSCFRFSRINWLFSKEESYMVSCDALRCTLLFLKWFRLNILCQTYKLDPFGFHRRVKVRLFSRWYITQFCTEWCQNNIWNFIAIRFFGSSSVWIVACMGILWHWHNCYLNSVIFHWVRMKVIINLWHDFNCRSLINVTWS